jgi:hypothetical protein
MTALPSPVPGNPPANLEDYLYVSQQANDQVGIIINIGGVPTDPDSLVVIVSMMPDMAGVQPVFTGRNAVRQYTGAYTYTFLSTDTSVTGHYHLAWSYQLQGVPDTYLTPIEVGSYSPAYDALGSDMQGVIELVWAKFADIYDSQFGGPNLQSYFQSHFGRGRMAQLLQVAMMNINLSMQPINNYSLMAPSSNPNAPITGPEFPVAMWGGLLVQGLTIEVIKHLMRSYVEEPQAEGSNVQARLTRRDYLQRWGEMLQTEQSDYERELETFKIRQMFTLQPRVLVSGGVYGNFGPTRVAGNAAARPRYWTRWY